MVGMKDLIKISSYEWEIPQSHRDDMRGPVRIFATRRLLDAIMGDKSLDQAINAATLPGLVGHVVVMPDMHQGYGFPIGGVAATRYPDGVISPGAIGYDINCGVRLLASRIDQEEARPFLSDLATALDQHCPSGVGKKGFVRLDREQLDDLCRKGSKWALDQGYAEPADLVRTEESGCLGGAQPESVSARAADRGRLQIGTLGAGNHFIEVDIVEELFDLTAARVMGLRRGCLVLQIHCGSRGFGHQICTDYVKDFQTAIRKYGIHLPDRELVCAPMDSQEGRDYLGAMRCAANYAFVNRQVLAHQARVSFEEVFAGRVSDWGLQQVYDIAHNMGKIETHRVGGANIKVCVHRKGATRAFGPDSPEVPSIYRDIGQPVLVPGSMGTASWVLVGTKGSMERSFGSTCHGAGRRMSRSKARKEVWGKDLLESLEKSGIHVRAGSMAGLAEEAPMAYKDVDEVVETVASAGIASKVARLRPVAVIKG
jgi:tRNA-splicing ligase RtcB (3'-phosphate/5'-hydroxy nucleic acid ligase)